MGRKKLRKFTIKDMQQWAKKRRGRCLSKKYKDIFTRLKWKCVKGHVWYAVPNNVKRGWWCPVCSEDEKFEAVKKIAKSKGIRCFSKKYKGSNKKLKWQCREGHIWYARSSEIKGRGRCPQCRKKESFEKVLKIVAFKGGKCLSKNYAKQNTKVKWQCKRDHIWENTPHNIKNDQWCPYCAGKAKLTIEGMHALAKKQDGKCLSKKYVSNEKKLKWRCKYGHVFKHTPTCIKKGLWCPVCRKKGKNKNLKIFEELLKYKKEAEELFGNIQFKREWGQRWSRIYTEYSSPFELNTILKNMQLKMWMVNKMKDYYRFFKTEGRLDKAAAKT